MRNILVLATAVTLSLAGCSKPADNVEGSTSGGETPPSVVKETSPPAYENSIVLENIALQNQFTASELVNVEPTEVGVVLSVTQSNESLPASGGFTDGAYIRLGTNLETAIGGKTIKVSFVAKSDTLSSASLMAAYSTADVGNSGWVDFQITNVPSEYSFTYDVAEPIDFRGDYIGFVPGVDGGIELTEVSIQY